MLKLDIYTMKIRPFFVEILLLGKKIYIYIKMKNINKYIKKTISPRRDLNSRPLVYKTSALTPELRRLVVCMCQFMTAFSFRFFKVSDSCLFYVTHSPLFI